MYKLAVLMELANLYQLTYTRIAHVQNMTGTRMDSMTPLLTCLVWYLPLVNVLPVCTLLIKMKMMLMMVTLTIE